LVAHEVGEQFGKYRILGLLGAGGMGAVYKAIDTSKNRVVALKILADQYSQDRRFRERFQRESHAAAILQEPHVIAIHDWGEIDGHLYIDMRLAQGQTLHDLVRDRPLEPRRAISIVEQIASALDAAHDAGLIHRDVKPHNIMVTATDFACLVDFGIAEVEGDTRLTMTGTQVGSVAYMAPERFSDGNASKAVDVYALTCVLVEALTGQPPYRGDLQQVIAAHVSTPPPSVSAHNPLLPAGLDAVIARGMAKEPDDRYGSAGALARAAIRAVTAEVSVPSQAVTLDRIHPFAAGPTPPPYVPATVSPPVVGPPTGPTHVVDAGSVTGRGRAGVAIVIAVVGALILGGIGIVIGMLAGRTTPAPPVPSTSTTAAPTVPSRSPTPTTAESMPPTGEIPPLVTGPDNSRSHDVCDDGWVLNDATGWGTRAGRGTPETSCFFARNVLVAYWNKYGNASRELRPVSAPGAVDCDPRKGAVCDGARFAMQCKAYGSDGWITCLGGINARVYLF